MSARRPNPSLALALVTLLALTIGLPTVALGAPPLVAQETEAEHAAQEPEHVGEEEHGEEGDHGTAHPPSTTDYIFKWINFVMLLGLLWWLLVVPPAFVVENFDFPGLKVVLATRADDIVESRDLARQQLSEAETRIEESEARLARVEQEAAALVVEAQEDAGAERQRLVTEAEAEAARIRDLADRDMGAEVARARRDLRRHVADLSISIASDLVKDNFSGQDQERLVREYLDRLGQTVG